MEKSEEALRLLRDIKHINYLIKELEENIDVVYTKLTSTTSKIKDVDVQTSLPTDPMAEKIIQVVEFQKELEEYQIELIEKKRVVLNVIKKMEVKSQEYIILKYFSGKNIEEIGNKVGYAYRQTWENIHTAEKEFVELYEKFA